MRISARAIGLFRKEVRSRTPRVRRVPGRELLGGLDTYLRGWAGYYARFDGCRNQLKELDAWIRRRIRQWLWVGWKTPRNRRRQLRQGGVREPVLARSAWIRSAWKAAGSQAMCICVTNARIERAGLPPLMRHWQRFAA